MTINLAKETICDVFTAEYCAATEGIMDFSISFVESVVTELIHHQSLNETRNKRFNRWSRSDTILQALIDKIVYDPGFIAPIAAFEKHCVISPIEKELTQEPPVPNEILSAPNHSPSALTGTTLDKESKARRLSLRRQVRKD